MIFVSATRGPAPRCIFRPGRILTLTILLALLIAPLAAASAGCTGCGMVWTDTCVPFENNNETAYNAEMLQAYVPIAANLTVGIADYRDRSWTEAFSSLSQLMKERYAFTEWRAVDFDALYNTWAPVIAEAEKNGDKAAYYRAVRGYLYAIPDGHVNVLATEGDFGARYTDIGGGYGIAVSRLDDGRVIVSYVANGSAAEDAGIRYGDTVIAWNGMPVMDAIAATPDIWATKKPSTAEGITLQKTRLLTRGTIGNTASVTIEGTSGLRTVTLTAYEDGANTIQKTSWFLGKQVNDLGAMDPINGIKSQISNDTVTYRTLPGGYAYIAIYEESYEVYQPFKAAMQDAIAKKAPGMVIDLRFNGGGDDNLASCFAGWFVDRPVFYEYTTKYDPGAGTFAVLSEAWTRPRPERYTGPVAVMVSPDTISSGEGLPMVFKRTGTGTIISWYGTNGAFGMNGPQAILPLGLYIVFPDGASLDENGVIQVDSNSTLTGGIAPQVRVPLNEETVARAMAGEDVQLAYAMQWLNDQQQVPGTATTPQESPAGIAVILAALAFLGIMAGRK